MAVGGLIGFLEYFRAWGESDETGHGRGSVHLAIVIVRSVVSMIFYFAMFVRARCNGNVVLGNILLLDVLSMLGDARCQRRIEVASMTWLLSLVQSRLLLIAVLAAANFVAAFLFAAILGCQILAVTLRHSCRMIAGG